MASGAYTIRFIMSVQDRTRNSFNRIIADTRRLSKADKQLAEAQAALNAQMRAATLAQRDQTAAQAAAIKQEALLRRNLQSTLRTRRTTEKAIGTTEKALRLNQARIKELQASELKYAQMAKHSNSVMAQRGRLLLDANRIRQKEIEQFENNALGKQLARQKRQLHDIISSQMSYVSQIGRSKTMQAMFAQQLAMSGAALTALSAKEDDLRERIEKRQDTYDRRMRVGGTMRDVGRSLQIQGLLATAAGLYAGQQAATFDTGAMKAATQVQTGQSLTAMSRNSAALQKEILGLMGQFPAKAQEMEDASYQIYSAMNVNFKQGLGFLRLFNATAVAGATDLATATNAGITLFNNFGGTAQKNARIMDTAFAIIRLGRMEFDDFNDMLNQVVPVAKATGQSLEDVGGAMAFVTSRIPSQRQSATAIARLLEVFSRGDFRKGMRELGASIEDERGNLLALPKIVEQVNRLPLARSQSGLNELIPFVTSVGRGGGKGITSTIQARKALSLLITQMDEYHEKQKLVAGAEREFQKRYEMMIGTQGVKWEKFKSQLQAVFLILGQGVLNALPRIMAAIGAGLDTLKNNQGLLKLIGTLTIVLGMLSMLAGLITSVGGAFVMLGGNAEMLVGTGGTLSKVATGFGRIGVTALIAVAAIQGLIDVIKEFTMNDVEGNFLQKAARSYLVAVKGFMKRMPKGKIIGTQFKVAEEAADFLLGQDWLVGSKTPKSKRQNSFKTQFMKSQKEYLKMFKQAGLLNYSNKMKEEMNKALGMNPGSTIQDWFNTGGGKNTKQTAAQITQEVKSIRDQVQQNLESLYSQFKNDNETMYGKVFQGPWMNSDRYKWFEQFGIGPNMNDMIKDLQMQGQRFRQYRNNLAKLTKKGIPDDLLTELKSMGVDGLVYIKNLANAGPNELKKFLTAWKQRGKDIDVATKIDFDNKLKQWNTFGADMALQIAAGFKSETREVADMISGVIDDYYAAAIRKLAVLNVAARQAAEFGGTLDVPDKYKALPVSMSYLAAQAAGLTGGYGNPGTFGTAGRPLPIPTKTGSDGRKGSPGAGRGPTRTPSSTDSTIVNIYGLHMTPEEAFRDAATKVNFRKQSSRRR